MAVQSTIRSVIAVESYPGEATLIVLLIDIWRGDVNVHAPVGRRHVVRNAGRNVK